ncbi:hypothetical protein GALMADRAFT_1086983 [Galerina marginata CBS 339.88]|uniref:Uncharacterized protein n=1 Tax=Galerina marginata (strain CBS 339.88) TaxID=685588 RepID=A0A067SIE7_GALM3|nr:hypothetical protein GALMADRAFT_1086983 [Galerina marginata CBS 339.88]
MRPFKCTSSTSRTHCAGYRVAETDSMCVLHSFCPLLARCSCPTCLGLLVVHAVAADEQEILAQGRAQFENQQQLSTKISVIILQLHSRCHILANPCQTGLAAVTWHKHILGNTSLTKSRSFAREVQSSVNLNLSHSFECCVPPAMSVLTSSNERRQGSKRTFIVVKFTIRLDLPISSRFFDLRQHDFFKIHLSS